MPQRLHPTDHYLKLCFYFVSGLIGASAIALLFFQIIKPLPKPPDPPTLPAIIPSNANYAWSPDYTKVAFQDIRQNDDDSKIIIVNIATNTSTTLATIPDAQAWFGQVTLAWLNDTTLAYSYIVTDDSLPSWIVLNNSTINQTIWENRDIISLSPDYQKILSTVVPNQALTPSQALEYEVVLPTSNTIISTHLNALTNRCVWKNSNQLNCRELASNIEKNYPLGFFKPSHD